VTPSKSVEPFARLPEPGPVRTLDELVVCLRSLKVWAGDPSYEVITDRINVTWSVSGRPAVELARRGTVVDCFRTGRRRINTDLLLAVVRALHPDTGYVAQWRQALRVVLGETHAAAQVRAQDTLPADLAEFTGRTDELRRLRHIVRRVQPVGGAVVISAIEGMAGVGKTQLAVHVGHLLAREQRFDHVLFVNLRGFHPDPAQPPADPAAVLDSFLRLLGVPGHQIAHDLAARTAMFRQRLAGKRALLVLDNAATEDQVRPLLPDSTGCLTFVTSRRHLTGLPASHLTVDVFAPDEAVEYLAHAAPEVSVGDDPAALERVARRCVTPGWTLTDHADRLDERHDHHRLDRGVELALQLSYQQLPAERRRMFRLLALHPGDDLDAYAAATLANTDLQSAEEHLRHLWADHLLQRAAEGRYIFHDLVRAYAADRATDEDRRRERRAALTRLFDLYLHTAASAMNILAPPEPDRRPHVPPPTGPTPRTADPAEARTWLDSELPNLVAAAVHAATGGWPQHATQLAATLYRHLDVAGHYTEAITLHTHAAEAAHRSGDHAAEAQALTNLGNAQYRLARYQQAADHYERALILCRELADRHGEAHALGNLANAQMDLGKYQEALVHSQQAVTLCREIGNRLVEARATISFGRVNERLGSHQQATAAYQQALDLCREVGDQLAEAVTLSNLGSVYQQSGNLQLAADHFQRALDLCREIGYQVGEGYAMNALGMVNERLGHQQAAAHHYRHALTQFRKIGDRNGEARVLNNLGGMLGADRRHDQAHAHHTAALALADQTGDRHEQARAHDGLAHSHHATGDTDHARHHWHQALALYTDLGVPDANQIRTHLAALDTPGDGQP
jgi:tetratricopeptide (TPR) repeat protein